MSTYRTLADAMEAARALDRAERFAAMQRDRERESEREKDNADADRRRDAGALRCGVISGAVSEPNV